MSCAYFWEFVLLHAHYKLFQQIWQYSFFHMCHGCVLWHALLSARQGVHTECEMWWGRNRCSLTRWIVHSDSNSQWTAPDFVTKSTKKDTLGSFDIVKTSLAPDFVLCGTPFATCREWILNNNDSSWYFTEGYRLSHGAIFFYFHDTQLCWSLNLYIMNVQLKDS